MLFFNQNKWQNHFKKDTQILHSSNSTNDTKALPEITLLYGLSKNFFKNFTAPFYGWGSTASKLEPLGGGSLLFTTKFPEIPGTHFIDLRTMKGWVKLGATYWFWTGDP